MKKINIAIDGPASSGKSTIAKRLAERLNYVYLDTGAMYRCVTLLALKGQVEAENSPALNELLESIDIQFETDSEGQKIFLNGRDVTKAIRQDHVTQAVSAYSAIDRVRQAMVERQQSWARNHAGLVMDGRDIGTVVLPDADLKIFLTASAAVRAKRRFLENQAKGLSEQTIEELTEAIEARDYYDAHRENSPLKAAGDAIVIDSSDLNLDQVEEKILSLIEEKE
ncbi:MULTISPECIES: (d)CMP kinase [Aerococcus]|uniref:(d)CMP kinase n=1 Tax=Aerococcus TaxID=1375 RepID=UPI0018A70FC1|nr:MULTISPECIES: (d)CMP kinase [Aerococcus]MCY3036528.1 (d)CMP kinase [Aerococcus sp. Group 2]MCY3039489.1 (d)CMP kinase [Aerococcus sp. Group 2]MCY3041391.1 (d)CMP kinase [Aerococcus sp. Group 2]MCY3042943.1 (d)CMP kinase [Aerococcus sp. Group 2]MDK6520584.1 (d)CMP kinase [Aerococcus urinae]